MWLRGVVVWLLLALVAVAAGGLREGQLVPRFGESGAHLIGTVAVVLFFLAVIAGSVQWIVPGLERPHLLRLGVFWVLLTVAFEFGFGHFVVGHPWSRLLHDYNLLAGRVWLLVLLTLLFAPSVLGRLKS